MKKLLFLFLFAIAINFASAQDAKPTKEETQKFITNMISQVIGSPQKAGKSILIKSQSFNEKFTEFTIKKGIGDDNNYIYEYNNISWGQLTDFQIQEEGFVSILVLLFKSNLQQKIKESDGKVQTSFTISLLLYVPTEKLESCKKAFLRLKGIAEEENKDPFQK